VDVANSLVGSTTQSSECIYAGCIARDAALSVEQFKKLLRIDGAIQLAPGADSLVSSLYL